MNMITFAAACGSVSEAPRIELTEVNHGDPVSITPSLIQDFVTLDDEKEIAAYLIEKAGKTRIDYCEPVWLNWYGESDSYRITLSTDKNMTNDKTTYATEGGTKRLALYNLLPDTVYYYTISDGDGKNLSETGSFTTMPGVRIVSIEGGGNIRDLGGWDTSSGTKLPYGKLYRGGGFNGGNGSSLIVKNEGVQQLLDLGIKSEIDLRGFDEDDDLNAIDFNGFKAGEKQNDCWFRSSGFDTRWLKAPFRAYGDIFDDNANFTFALKNIFTFLADESNYPIYFHCVGGADRTGTLAYLIGGLLGISYEDLAKDYELTTFSRFFGHRYRSEIISTKGVYSFKNITADTADGSFPYGEGSFAKMHAVMLQRYGKAGGTLADAIQNYLLHCGVKFDEILSLKKIMLGLTVD